MSDDELAAFVEESMDRFLAKQESLLSEYGVGSHDRWHFDQATETLRFFNEAGELVLEADVVAIGSYASNSNTWQWAWSNDSLLPAIRHKAEPLRELQTVTGLDLFDSESAILLDDDDMAWELVAMCVRQLGALGGYRAPSSSRSLAIFLAITRFRHVAV